MTRIIGIDPGSRKTGFGIIEFEGQKVKHIINGRLMVGDGNFPDRLGQIFKGLTDIIQRYQVTGSLVGPVQNFTVKQNHSNSRFSKLI